MLDLKDSLRRQEALLTAYRSDRRMPRPGKQPWSVRLITVLMNQFRIACTERMGGGEFVIDDSNREALRLIFWWMMGVADPRPLDGEGPNPNWEGAPLNPNKGLLLTGPVGSGKTTLLHGIKQSMITIRNSIEHKLYDPDIYPIPDFMICSAKDLSLSFSRGGYEAIMEYGSGAVAFDDVGEEVSPVSYCKTSVNVMRHLLEKRYDNGCRNCTLMVLECSGREFVEKYGEKMGSRLTDMFNIVPLQRRVARPDAPL